MPGKSPNYPSISLPEAVERIRKVYRTHGKNSITTEDAVNSWGHKGLHGPAVGELSALKKYGLLQSIGKNQVKLTDLALSLILGEVGGFEYQAALEEAAKEPDIFREILETEQTNPMSDRLLKMHLIKTKNFTETGADKFIKSYRETISLASPPKVGDNVQKERETALGGESKMSSTGTTITPEPVSVGVSAGNPTVVISEGLSYRISEECKINLQFEGKITKQAIQKLIKYLELAKDDYPTSAKESAASQNEP